MPGPADGTINIAAAIVESSPDAIITAEIDGTITSWNAAAERITGFPSAEAIGRKITSLIPQEDVDNALGMLARVHRGDIIQGREVVRMRHDGSQMIGLLTLAPIRDGAGKVCGSVGILHDVTERKAVEQFLRRNERLASIGTLAAGLAHEINNPVGGILMAAQYAGAALERPDARDVVEKALGNIEADAKRCGDILRRLQRLADEERSERTPCDVNDVIESALRIALHEVDDLGVETHFERVDDLPAIRLSRPEIEQALVNLINNSIEADSRDVSIEVELKGSGEALRIDIRDDGSGIPDDVIDHLFDPFYTTKRRAGSAGLGLSLAHAIVTEHGGSLDVASCAREGTTVTLHLPLRPPPGG